MYTFFDKVLKFEHEYGNKTDEQTEFKNYTLKCFDKIDTSRLINSKEIRYFIFESALFYSALFYKQKTIFLSRF